MVQGIELAVCVCVCVCVCALRVTQLCLSICHPMDCSPPGSSVHALLQVVILELVPVPSSRGIFLTHGSNLSLLHLRQILYCLIPRGAPRMLSISTRSGGTVTRTKERKNTEDCGQKFPVREEQGRMRVMVS